MLTMGAAFGCFVVMTVYDWMHWSSTVEESLKLVSGVLILIAFLGVYLDPQQHRLTKPASAREAAVLGVTSVLMGRGNLPTLRADRRVRPEPPSDAPSRRSTVTATACQGRG